MLFYTGAVTPEERQQDPSLSLGGFKSSSTIANGELHNLFPTITQNTIKKDIKIIRMIIFANITTSTIANLRIYSTDSEHSVIKIAGVLPGYDDKCKQYFFEKVASETHIPYQGTLQSYDIANPLVVGALEPNKMIGLWIQKSLKLDSFSNTELDNLPCEQLAALLEEVQQAEEDNLQLHFDWD